MNVGDLFTRTAIPTRPCEHCGDPVVDCIGGRMHFEVASTGARTAWNECRTGDQAALFGALDTR